MFAVMRWITDRNKLSVSPLKLIVKPNDTQIIDVGTEGESRYPGYPGLWKFRILRIGEKKALEEWLQDHILQLMEDVTDKAFTEHKKDTPKTPKKRKLEDEEDTQWSEGTPQMTKRTPKKSKGTPTNSNSTPKKSNSTPKKSTPPKSIAPKRNIEDEEDTEWSEGTPQKSKRTPTKSKGTPTKSNSTPKKSTPPKSIAPKRNIDLSRFEYLQTGRKTENEISLKKRIKDCEEENRSLRRKIKKIEERINKLEASKDASPKESLPSPKEKYTISSQRGQYTISSPKESSTLIASPKESSTLTSSPKEREYSFNTEETLIPKKETENNNISSTDTESEIEVDIKSIKGNDRLIVKNIIQKIFTDEELRNCSRTGKKTIKSGEQPKPALNSAKFTLAEKLVLKHTMLDKQTFHKKFENIQKCLIRDFKKS